MVLPGDLRVVEKEKQKEELYRCLKHETARISRLKKIEKNGNITEKSQEKYLYIIGSVIRVETRQKNSSPWDSQNSEKAFVDREWQK